jgi:hypothetical protein
MFQKSGLHGMQLVTFRQAFYGRNFIALMRDRQSQAAINPSSIYEHGAGSALATVATLFGSRQRKVFAQCVEQGHARIERQTVGLPVDVQLNRHEIGCDGFTVAECPGGKDWYTEHHAAGQNSCRLREVPASQVPGTS